MSDERCEKHGDWMRGDKLVWCPTCEVERLAAALADARAENERLSKYFADLKTAYQTDVSMLEQYAEHCAALESHQRWVAVSERLPTESCYCNVGYGPGRLRWAIAWCSVIEGEAPEFNDEAGDDITDQVYAWVAVPPLGDLPARSEGA